MTVSTIAVLMMLVILTGCANVNVSVQQKQETCNAVFEKYDEATAKSNFEELFNEQGSADVIDFHPVVEKSSADALSREL